MSHRDLLLDAARRLVKERGYARVSARDLVAASGTNLGSIGYHFGSKEALLQEAIGALFDEWTEHLGRAALADATMPPLQRVVTSWRTMLLEFGTVRALFLADLEAITAAERSEPLRRRIAEHYDASRRTVAAMVLEALPDAREQGLDAEAVGALLLAVADGLMLQHLIDPERAPSADRLDEALRTALRLAAGAAAPDA